MEVLILGAILQYMVSASFKLFLMVGKGLKERSGTVWLSGSPQESFHAV